MDQEQLEAAHITGAGDFVGNTWKRAKRVARNHVQWRVLDDILSSSRRARRIGDDDDDDGDDDHDDNDTGLST